MIIYQVLPCLKSLRETLQRFRNLVQFMITLHNTDFIQIKKTY